MLSAVLIFIYIGFCKQVSLFAVNHENQDADGDGVAKGREGQKRKPTLAEKYSMALKRE